MTTNKKPPQRHGKYKTAEYSSWQHMKARCLNPNNRNYHSYGGRGISVCDRWKGSFIAFLEDMGQMPGRGYSIDRIDNNGDYEPGNCRWANRFEQAANMQHVVMVEIDGEWKCLSEWCRIYKRPLTTVVARMKSLGMPARDAIVTPRLLTGWPARRARLAAEGAI